MKMELEKVKRNIVGLVDHLPTHYQLEFAAYLFEQFELYNCSQPIWDLTKDPLYAPEIFKTKMFLVKQGKTEETFIEYLINTAATVAKIFDKDVIVALAMEVIGSVPLPHSIKDPLMDSIVSNIKDEGYDLTRMESS